MKNLFATSLIAFLLSTTSENCFAQWTPVYQDINTVYGDAAFPTDNTGYVTAADSAGAVVLYTNDGGSTWSKKYISGWSYISKIAMTDSLTGYLIKSGVPVQLLKTSDGFTTYSIHNLDSCYAVMSLELINDSTGFYLNNETRLRKFKNSGTNFFHVFDTLSEGQNLQFTSSSIGYLDNGTRLLKTIDGGSTWNYVNNTLGFYTASFRFADSLNGYFHDGDNIYKTNDGGVSFTLQFNFPGATTFSALGNYCMAANNIGNVAYTTDGGITWQQEITGINWISSETYILKNTPGGDYFLFSEFCGEIRKRQPIVAGISNVSDKDHMILYPNPTTDCIIVKSDVEVKKISISDQYGKVVKDIEGKENQICIGGLMSGLYFVTLIDKDGRTSIKKLVKK